MNFFGKYSHIQHVWNGKLGWPIVQFFFEVIQNMLHILKIMESLTIKVDATKFPQLIITYLQESCKGVEAHNDSKELVGGLQEVVIFTS